MTAKFSTHGLTKRFGRKTVLTDVSIELQGPGITVLLGPNGAGKSTLLSCAIGLLKPEKGFARTLGLDPLRQAHQVACSVGYVPDQPDAPDWMTPRELFAFLKPQYATWNTALVKRMATDFSLPLDTRLSKLSRGQGAKTMFVAALAFEPELVLMDEPFSGLDPIMRNELLRGFLTEFTSEGRTALIATHDLEVAGRIADSVLVLHEGRISAHGRVGEVLGEDNAGRLPERLYSMLAAGLERQVA